MVRSRSKDLAALAELTGAVLAARQAGLRNILAKEEELRRKLRDLSRSVKDRAAETVQAVDPAMLAGADMRWHIWIEERHASLTAELARTLAEKDSHREALAKAFGRDRATIALHERARIDQQRERMRRVDNDG